MKRPVEASYSRAPMWVRPVVGSSTPVPRKVWRPGGARPDMHARPADAREASALALPVGSPILAGAHRRSNAEGVIEYGE
ncbi:hypothetical protein GCM10023329_53720 [Streptomyces sanyensis]|uniref:Uncharacterized protein n=1 Tax=Streptomyces sanyensis TaxID=568869 RepID=A0ABP9BHE2_9ACTN